MFTLSALRSFAACVCMVLICLTALLTADCDPNSINGAFNLLSACDREFLHEQLQQEVSCVRLYVWLLELCS